MNETTTATILYNSPSANVTVVDDGIEVSYSVEKLDPQTGEWYTDSQYAAPSFDVALRTEAATAALVAADA